MLGVFFITPANQAPCLFLTGDFHLFMEQFRKAQRHTARCLQDQAGNTKGLGL
jgi:hypothetical protein